MQQGVRFSTCSGLCNNTIIIIILLDYTCTIFQSNEVGGSYHMEKEGLHRLLEFLEVQGLKVDILVTDRHKQINKWIRENYPEVKHYYDIWHVAKGLYILASFTRLYMHV